MDFKFAQPYSFVSRDFSPAVEAPVDWTLKLAISLLQLE